MGELSKSDILRLYSIIHVAMEATKTAKLTCQSKSLISIFFTCQVSACELQPCSCHDSANDIYTNCQNCVQPPYGHTVIESTLSKTDNCRTGPDCHREVSGLQRVDVINVTPVILKMNLFAMNTRLFLEQDYKISNILQFYYHVEHLNFNYKVFFTT